MTLREKLDDYFTENGIQRKWFAKKIGISPGLFFRVTSGNRKMPRKHWSSIIALTNGKITLRDLIEDTYGDKDGLLVTPGKCPNQCILSLKEIN